MNKVSVAIPTYNPSSYLELLLKNLNKINQIKEIVINDDNSNKSELRKVETILSNFANRSNKDIRFFKNIKNLGPYDNKFIAISKCKMDYVYQIDQDNLPNIMSLKWIFKFNKLMKYKNCLILPGKNYPFRFDHQKEKRNRKSRIVTFNKNIQINTKQIIPMLENQNSKINEMIRHSLALGNPIVCKADYKLNLQEGFGNRNIIHDTAAIAYYWLKNGGKIQILKNFSLHTRRHNDSYYSNDPRGIVSSKEISVQGSKYFDLITKL